MERGEANESVSSKGPAMCSSTGDGTKKEEREPEQTEKETPEEAADPTEEELYEKPAYSYATLITQAIIDSAEKKLTLRAIYSWIMGKYPYFKRQRGGWQNSIRHNLSLNKCFYKIPRAHNDPGKGSYWTVDSEYLNVFSASAKPKRASSDAEPCREAAECRYKQGREEGRSSFTEILNNEKNFFDSIGVSDKHLFSKSFDSSVFDGNLRDIDGDGIGKLLSHSMDSDLSDGTSKFFKFTK